jgi:murein DD-endopeptidase MepM/ murein hydrolase activator NlpD
MRDTMTATLVLALMDEILGPWRGGLTDDALDGASPLPPGMARVMAPYGRRAAGGLAAGGRFHAGIDFWAPRGTPVFAVRPGVVERVVLDDRPEDGFVGYGNAVVVRHAETGAWTFSAHLDEVLVAQGMEIERGQILGRVGNTTNGRLLDLVVRLHFEVRLRRGDGASPFPGPPRLHNVDPALWLACHGVRVDREGRLVPRSRCGADQVDRWLEEDVEYVEPPDRDELVLVSRGFEAPTPVPTPWRPGEW